MTPQTSETSETPPKPGPKHHRRGEMLRVDHAGEFAAVQIYRGQRAVFDRAPNKSHLSDQLKQMEEGEQHHLETFNQLLTESGTRPTIFTPLWHVASYALGAGTALLGEKAAMTCTSAVEDVIEKHYLDQAQEIGDRDAKLRDLILEFRDDELEHKQTALEGGAETSPGHTLLKAVIQTGCRLAIKVSEKA